MRRIRKPAARSRKTRFGRARAPVAVLVKGIVALALAGTVPLAGAQCSLNAQGVAFGPYDPFSFSALDGVGSVSVRCDAPTSFTVSLGTGSGTYEARSMTNGAHQLFYNLYTDPARAVVWGDGSGGTAVLSDTAASGVYTVYGRIPERQNAHVGAYSDNVTVFVDF